MGLVVSCLKLVFRAKLLLFYFGKSDNENEMMKRLWEEMMFQYDHLRKTCNPDDGKENN